jgi:uncharacterized membrane protein YfhO
MLRVSERWDPDWKATIDGQAVEVKRIDYICQGVELPPGSHTVKLYYSPAMLFFYLQLAGLLVLVATSISLFFTRKSPARDFVKVGAAVI